MNWQYVKWLYDISHGYKKIIIIPILLNLFAVLLSLFFVDITQKLLEGNVSKVGGLILILVITKILQLAFEQTEIYIRELSSAKMENALSLRIFSSLFDSKISDEKTLHSGDEMYRLTSDVFAVVQSVTYVIPIMIYAFVQLFLTCCYLMTIEPVLTIILAVIMPFAILVGRYYTKKMIPISRKVRICNSKVNVFMQEHLQHHELINTLRKNDFIKEQLKKLQYNLFHKQKSQITLDIVAESFVDIGFAFGFIVIFIWGVFGIKNDTFSYSQLIAFMQLTGQIQRPFVLFKAQYPAFVSSFASIERLIEVENLPKEETGDPLFLYDSVGIRFENMSFRYSEDSRWIHKDFSYNFTQGSTTTIIGETGSGKSTLLRLILSINYPTKGSVILYDDKNEYKASPLTRGNCIYVPQGNSIISGSIRYNLLLGNLNASEEDMINALYNAAAEFVINDFPNGLDTIVGEEGHGISEGQAQRIAIARSFLCPGQVILMDEPTSALDNETEKLFLERVTSTMLGKTIIIITHKQEIKKYVSDIVTINYLRE